MKQRSHCASRLPTAPPTFQPLFQKPHAFTSSISLRHLHLTLNYHFIFHLPPELALKPWSTAPSPDDERRGEKNNQWELSRSYKMNANDFSLHYLWKSEIIMQDLEWLFKKLRKPRPHRKDELSSCSRMKQSAVIKGS